MVFEQFCNNHRNETDETDIEGSVGIFYAFAKNYVIKFYLQGVSLWKHNFLESVFFG